MIREEEEKPKEKEATRQERTTSITIMQGEHIEQAVRARA